MTVSDDRAGRKEGIYGKTQDAVLSFFQRQPQFGVDKFSFWKCQDLTATEFYQHNKNMLDDPDSNMNGRCYKPFVILEGLRSISDGEFLIYNDVSPNMWVEYLKVGTIDSSVYSLEIVKKLCVDNGGVLSACARLTLPGKTISSDDIFDHIHENFTLERCINKMGLGEYRHSLQHASGMVVLQKNQKSLNFVEEWLRWNVLDECASLGTVDPEKRSEFKYNFWKDEEGSGKIGHRHDQSISGLLINKMSNRLVRETEDYCFLNFCRKNKIYEFVDSNQPPAPYRLKMRQNTTDGTDGTIDRFVR